jgi:hypothetical protein
MVDKKCGTGSSRGCELKVRWPRKWRINFTTKFSLRMPKFENSEKQF